MSKKGGLSKKGIPERHREEFEKLYQEATQMYAASASCKAYSGRCVTVILH